MTTNTGFDAAKTGKIPKGQDKPPPREEPTVELRFISLSMGFGLFAARDIKMGEWFLHEAPALIAPATDPKLIALEKAMTAYDDARHRYGNALLLAYPRIALDVGVTPVSANAMTCINDGLSQELDPSEVWARPATITQQQYDAYLNSMGPAKVNAPRREKLLAVRSFFAHYSFVTQNPFETIEHSSPKEMYIYLVGSMINHQCPGPEGSDVVAPNTTGPNSRATVGKHGSRMVSWIGLKHLAVQARRDIARGEEIRFDYHKDRRNFKCTCQTCKDKKSSCVVM